MNSSLQSLSAILFLNYFIFILSNIESKDLCQTNAGWILTTLTSNFELIPILPYIIHASISLDIATVGADLSHIWSWNLMWVSTLSTGVLTAVLKTTLIFSDINQEDIRSLNTGRTESSQSVMVWCEMLTNLLAPSWWQLFPPEK